MGAVKMRDWVQLIGGGRLVLVVDDDAQIRAYIKTILKGADFQVLEAADGVNALEVFDVWRKSIDLVITDIRMPRMTGRDLARSLRSQRPAIPVLFVSGESASPDLNDPGKGFFFLEKPFGPKALLDIVRRLLQLIPVGC